MKDNFILTFTGKKFYPFSANINDICLEDIAQALSNICRYNGHCPNFYSVSEHCVYVSNYLYKQYEDSEIALLGLLHDSAEAYIGDIPSPVKHLFSGIKDIENNLLNMIYSKLTNISVPLSEKRILDIKTADLTLLYTELNSFMSKKHKLPQLPKNFKVIPDFEFKFLEPKKALKLFVDKYFELKNEL